MPNVNAADVRIKIEAVDNYFFDVNDASFKLTATPETTPTPTPTPTTPPVPGAADTTITAGPADGSVVLDPKQSFTYASTVAPAAFVCKVDGGTVPCVAAGLTEILGGHARVQRGRGQSAGVADTTPATRTFTVPLRRRSAQAQRSLEAGQERRRRSAVTSSPRATAGRS